MLLKKTVLVLFSLSLPFFLISCSDAPYKQVRMMMGTLNEIEIFDLKKQVAQKAVEKGFDAMQRVDDLMSHYKESSEVSRIKNSVPLETVRVSQDTFNVLKRSEEIAQLSDGAFDVTIGPLVKRWGFYDKEQKPLPTRQEINRMRRGMGYVHLFLRPKNREVSKRIPTLEVDLGGIAKGYAIDLAVKALKQAGVVSATVNSGGNIGFIGNPVKGEAWEVGVIDPLNPSELLGVLNIKEGAVATSGNYENYHEIEGKRYSHIIDPRTGWPVQGVLSVTVIAANAMDADALSTTLFVLGPKQGLVLAEKLNAKALFVLETENGKPELVFSKGLETQFKP